MPLLFFYPLLFFRLSLTIIKKKHLFNKVQKQLSEQKKIRFCAEQICQKSLISCDKTIQITPFHSGVMLSFSQSKTRAFLWNTKEHCHASWTQDLE